MLPDHPLVLHGGYNCGAIRCKIHVPARPQRPLNPFSDGIAPLPHGRHGPLQWLPPCYRLHPLNLDLRPHEYDVVSIAPRLPRG